MGLTRELGWSLLCDWTPSAALRIHARSVEIVMRAAAKRYGGPEADPEEWGLAGMLHDADYDRWPDEHPQRITAHLRDLGLDAVAHAVSAHYTKWGVAHESPLDKALLACDELTGFVGACCFVRPDGIQSLAVSSVKKKLKDKAFAAKVERSEIQAGVDLLGVSLDDHIAFVIEALKPYASELGLSGKGTI